MTFGTATTYTLYRVFGKSRNEVWKITDGNAHIAHWISDNGTVWVLASRTRQRDSAVIWSRGLDASETSNWNLGNASRCVEGRQPAENLGLSNVDVDNSTAKTLGDYRVDQLNLKLKTGGTVRCTLMRPEHEAVTPVLRYFPSGAQITDLLTDAAAKSSAQVTWPIKYPKWFSIWSFPASSQTTLIERLGGMPYEDGIVCVQSERAITQKPDYIAKTPAGRLAWFEFGGNSGKATLRLMDSLGNEQQAIDLVKLGRYASIQDAKQNLLYRDLAVLRYNQPISVEDADWYTGGDSETLQLNDRRGKTFMIEIKKGEGTAFTATAIASLNLGSAPSKEPLYADAKLTREENLKSENGLFRARMRRYESKEGPINQITLLSTITDPINGPKEVELWSNQVVDWPLDSRLSDSGRVLTIQAGTWPEGKLKGKEYAMLLTYEVTGKTMGGIEFITRGWFKSVAEMQSHLKLAKLQLSIEGKDTQVDENGIPVVFWKTERFAINAGDGKTYKLRVEANPQPGLPQMLYFDK